MSRIKIFTSSEQKRFDLPPKLSPTERMSAFMLNDEVDNIISGMRSYVNKGCFMLQLGYFKATGKFFSPDQFRRQDISYLTKMLCIDSNYIDISEYTKITRSKHKNTILRMQGWHNLDNNAKEGLITHVKNNAKNQPYPKDLMFTALNYLVNNKTAIPSYYYLSDIITNAYNNIEYKLTTIIDQNINDNQRDLLNNILNNDNELLDLSDLKKINQSLKTKEINKDVAIFNKIKSYYLEIEPLIEKLNLSRQATEYYSTWVKKSKLFQLKQFKDKSKYYLYILAFIKHQFFYRNDILVDILMKSVKSSTNTAKKKSKIETDKNKKSQNNIILKAFEERQDSKELLSIIKKILHTDCLSDTDKVSKITALLMSDTESEIDANQIKEITNTINGDRTEYYNHLTLGSNKLQRKISNIVLSLEFNEKSSDVDLLGAIEHFKNKEGKINSSSPLVFLSDKEQVIVNKDDKFNISLYKSLLFTKITESIKLGRLNLIYSYRYLSVFDYLIDIDEWNTNKDHLLKTYGLESFIDFNKVINELKKELDSKYSAVNKEYLDSNNKYLSLNKKKKYHVKTPKIDKNEQKVISDLLLQGKHIPILQLMADINNIVKFTKQFKHHSIKNVKSTPNEQTIFAGLIGKGCNIGVSRIANISKGLTVDTLKNTVNWYFDIKNIQEANNAIIQYINKLSLSSIFCGSEGDIHTSSDGQKINVNLDCILANYSFKYFGKSKGVSIYTFIDEKQSLFYSTVISASDREAAYVIDGLLNNRVIKSSIHSTDTHGFTESIFGLTYFINTSFAPRIKKVGEQTLYSFSSRSKYENKGYEILPKGKINTKLIRDNWDDILRFIATIKSGHTTASVLMQRLSSYAKHQPLYQALKEFGRVMKSIFILTYFNDVKLRQKMEKQLNMIELSNRFAKAIFFANSQELKEVQKEEQEIIIACRVLIQNVIILWNYLYLSQLIVNNKTNKSREDILTIIKNSSVMSWAHVNLHGEYDFNNYAANDAKFDIDDILDLNIA